MKSLWNDSEAARFDGPLGPRIYSSRLLGRDKSLVLHGGGNTSVKLREKNLFGEDEDVLHVKGSGWNLETIEAAGFTPVGLDYMRRLAALPALSDLQMMNELTTHTLRAGAPAPSVETLLHATLPYKYVDHTHADAVLAVSNAPEGEERVGEIYGDKAIIVPYVMAGFDLAVRCAREFSAHAGGNTLGMVLVSHGVLSWGAEAREAYERMIELVSMAERYLERHKAWAIRSPQAAPPAFKRKELALLRREVSRAAGIALIARSNSSPRVLGFARHAQVARMSQSGPATPDHVLHTRPVPMLGRDVPGFVSWYRKYFASNSTRAKEPKTMLDPAPRLALDAELRLVTFGRDAAQARVAEELYEHTIDTILRAEALGGWQALAERHIFDIEYWDLEQAKLKKRGRPPLFGGEAVVVTGAASGIGKACVEAFLARGAAVVGLDRNPAIESLWQRPDFLGLACDLTQKDRASLAIDAAVKAFRGVDMLGLNG